jgi:ribosomal 30S subunit maturation factor RimM
MLEGGASAKIGVIADIIEGGGGLLAEIALPSGEKKLVPYRDEFFGAVDLVKGTIVLKSGWILE